MSQDPWKRASQIKRLRDQQLKSAEPQGRAAEVQTRRRLEQAGIRSRRSAVWLLWLLLFVLAGGSVAAWYFRAQWIPRLKQQAEDSPAPLREAVNAVPEPQVVLDPAALDSGLGFGLRPDADYLELLAGMRGEDPGWKVTSTGADNARLSAPGAEVTVVGGRVQNYELLFKPLFAAKGWEPWLEGLRSAHLTPELTYTSLTGEREMPRGASLYELKGRAIKRADGWLHPVYELHFTDGYLISIKLALRFGPAEEDASSDGSADGQSPAAQKQTH